MTTLTDRMDPPRLRAPGYLLVVDGDSDGAAKQQDFTAPSDEHAARLARARHGERGWALYRLSGGECKPIESHRLTGPPPGAARDLACRGPV